MARPKKQGLDYFPLDVDFFQDRKIKRLRNDYGDTAISIYLFLLCEIYRDKGYYLVFDDDMLDDLVSTFGKSEDYILQVINFLCLRSLLDSKLFVSDKVITSAAIQKQYQRIKSGNGSIKNSVDVNSQLWILSDFETLDCIKVTQEHNKSANNPDKSANNPCLSAENATKERKVNKRKVNDSKVKGIKSDKPTKHRYGEYNNVFFTDDEIKKLKYEFSDWENRIERLSEYVASTGKTYKSHYATIRMWAKKDKSVNQKNDKSTSFYADVAKKKTNNFME